MINLSKIHKFFTAGDMSIEPTLMASPERDSPNLFVFEKKLRNYTFAEFYVDIATGEVHKITITNSVAVIAFAYITEAYSLIETVHAAEHDYNAHEAYETDKYTIYYDYVDDSTILWLLELTKQ